MTLSKVCRGCEATKEDSEFPVRKDRSGRLRPYCRDCSNRISKARYRNHKRNSPFKHRCTRAKSRASNLNVDFDLTPEYLESIWTGFCPVLGVPIDMDTDRRDELAAELDRFQPKLGYVKGNVHWLSRKVNRIKNNVSIRELESLVLWMREVTDES
jgi:hypothetical protein